MDALDCTQSAAMAAAVVVKSSPSSRPSGFPTGSWNVQVTPRDWRAALRDAPKPCSRRQGLDALLADAARPLAAHLAPLLVPSYTLARTLTIPKCRSNDAPHCQPACCPFCCSAHPSRRWALEEMGLLTP